MPEPKGLTRLDTWLSDKPSEFARILAARSALRLAPLLVESLHSDADSRRSTILLPSLRVLISASLAAASIDQADENLTEAGTVARTVTDLLEETAYHVEIGTVRLREIGEPECVPNIHAQEEDKKGLQGATEFMKAAQGAITTCIHHVSYKDDTASKSAPLSAARTTIDACMSALYYLYDGHGPATDFNNHPTHSKDNTAESVVDEVMAIAARSRQEMQALCSIDSDIENVVNHLSILSPSKDYIAHYNDFKSAVKQDMQVLCSPDVDAKGIAYCPSALSNESLWLDSIPIWISEKWIDLKSAMPKEEAWKVWIDWYESHLKGESLDETLESVFPAIPIKVWQDSVPQINSYLLEAVQTQRDPMFIALTDGLKELDAVSDSLDVGQYRSRIMTALTSDPRQAVGATKDLLEAVMKTILHRRGCGFRKNVKFNNLINTCWSELNLDSQNEP